MSISKERREELKAFAREAIKTERRASARFALVEWRAPTPSANLPEVSLESPE